MVPNNGLNLQHHHTPRWEAAQMLLWIKDEDLKRIACIFWITEVWQQDRCIFTNR